MRKINPENMQRFENVISHLQRIAMTAHDITLAMTSEADPYKDGAVYLMLPDAVCIPKPVMHSIYSACFAADRTELITTRQPRFVFIIRDVYTDGKEIPYTPGL